MGCSHNCDSCSSNCGGEKSLKVAANKAATVRKVIGVVSGKGGVGKSLLTSMMAVGMTRKGYTCGVLDADITGPSIPKTFGVHDKLEGCEEGIIPARSEGGVQMISINLVLPNEDDPVIYRGPIIAETVKQFWSDVVWEDVDFLFVDMPPGTGDVPLTVFQSLPVDGIIVVTSPQDLVSMIVGKAVKMAKMMNIPVLGIVENYSYLECPDCGKHISVFGESHVDEVAAHYELPVLAKLPIDPKLAEAVDAGKIEDAKLPDALSGALSTVEGLIAANLGSCKQVLVVTTEGREPVSKHMAEVRGTSTTDLIKLASMEQIDVLICGSLGLAIRNALEMIGVLLVPGCEGPAEEAVAKFLVGEKQGDPTLLEIGREEDPDDPMACMHDCAKCSGCGPSELLKSIPVEEVK